MTEHHKWCMAICFSYQRLGPRWPGSSLGVWGLSPCPCPQHRHRSTNAMRFLGNRHIHRTITLGCICHRSRPFLCFVCVCVCVFFPFSAPAIPRLCVPVVVYSRCLPSPTNQAAISILAHTAVTVLPATTPTRLLIHHLFVLHNTTC